MRIRTNKNIPLKFGEAQCVFSSEWPGSLQHSPPVIVAPGMTEFYKVTKRAGEVFHDNQEYRNHTTGHSVRESGSYGAMLEGRNPETDSGY
jgi:hypothetical protein